MPQPKIHDDHAARSRHYRQMQKLQRLGSLAALFPYYGGKSAVAPVIWQHLGDVRHYLDRLGIPILRRPSRPHGTREKSMGDWA